MLTDHKFYTVLDSVTATGDGLQVYVGDFRHCVLTIATSGTTTATIKAQGSIAEQSADVDFGSAASITNMWDYVQIVDLEDGAAVDGDTGVVYSGTDAVRQFEVNINSLNFFTLNVTAYTQGTIKAILHVSNNA